MTTPALPCTQSSFIRKSGDKRSDTLMDGETQRSGVVDTGHIHIYIYIHTYTYIHISLRVR